MADVATTQVGPETTADKLGFKDVPDQTVRPGVKRVSVVSQLLRGVYTDQRGNVSRPKLLFTVCGLDLATIVLCGLAAQMIYAPAQQITWARFAEVLFIAVATVSVLRTYWSYTISGLRSGRTQAAKVAKACFLVFSVATGIVYVAQLELLTPSAILVWFAFAVVALSSQRVGCARLLETLTEQGRLVRRTVIVGGGKEAKKVIEAFSKRGANQINILGIFDDRGDDRPGQTVDGFRKLGDFEQLDEFCREEDVELLIVTVPPTAETRLLQILQQLFALSVQIRISALSSKLRFNARAYSYVGGVPMLPVMDRPLTDWQRVEKNLTDRILGILMLIAAAPIMVATAIAIKLEDGGPIFFKQDRFGFNNELIKVWKFRSLNPKKADKYASKLVTKDDPRVTKIGRFIRKTSIDELPQLFNVLLGEMSLVGPRPHATQAKAKDDLYQTVVASYFARHRVKPGVTGWAQINGWRGETDTHEKIQGRVDADLYYIDNWSVLFDLYIIAMTPIALVTDKNAY